MQLYLDQLPVNGTLTINGSPAQTGFAYPAWQQFQYVPNLNFCGLDTVRAHLSYYAYNNGNANDIVGPFRTNTATAAIQVAPLLRIVGSSVLNKAQSCNGASQEGIVEDEDAVVAPEQSGVKTNFTAYLNNPREDGIPVEEQLTFSHIGPLLIFNAQGNQIHDGDSITVWVTGPISGSTQVPFSVESVVPGASPESFTVSGAIGPARSTPRRQATNSRLAGATTPTPRSRFSRRA